MEKRGSFARRGKREPIFGKVDSLYAPIGGIDGSYVDCGEHRAPAPAFARGANTFDSLSRSRAPAWRGSDFHAGHRHWRSAAPHSPSTQRHSDCYRQTARFAMDKLLKTRPAALAHAPQR